MLNNTQDVNKKEFEDLIIEDFTDLARKITRTFKDLDHFTQLRSDDEDKTNLHLTDSKFRDFTCIGGITQLNLTYEDLQPFRKTLEKISKCGQTAALYVCGSCGTKSHRLNHCDNNSCDRPDCVKHRKRNIMAYCKGFEEFMPKYRYLKRLDLNLPNIPLLHYNREAVLYHKRLFYKFVRILQTRYNLKGAIMSFEKTFNEYDQSFNYHAHILADMPYVPHEELKAEWDIVTGGNYSLRVSGHPGNDKKRLFEVIKYVTKPPESMPLFARLIVFMAEYNLRSYSKFGSFRFIFVKPPDEKVVCPTCNEIMDYFDSCNVDNLPEFYEPPDFSKKPAYFPEFPGYKEEIFIYG